MGKVYDEITPDLSDWLNEQKMFFVATAPLAADGLINCSPKGMDTFRVLGPREVAYLDLTGSGIETAAHLRENGRMVFMFCTFSGPPKIVRLHGEGEVVAEGHPDFEELIEHFPDYPGTRSVIRCRLNRISDSCGFGVPRYEYAGERDTLTRWAESKGKEGLADYRREHNRRSVDGLPGLEADAC
ncbi:MAG: pyridoxamine 5'-phosphate oxidase family protein [Rhodothermales bacterium]